MDKSFEEQKRQDAWIQWGIVLLINVIILVGSIMLAYGSLDKRLAIIETRQEQKVDAAQLQILLQKWKDDIVKDLKNEITKEFQNTK